MASRGPVPVLPWYRAGEMLVSLCALGEVVVGAGEVGGQSID